MSLTADMHSLISLVSSWDIEPPQISLALLLLDVELRFVGRTYFEIYAKQAAEKMLKMSSVFNSASQCYWPMMLLLDATAQ